MFIGGEENEPISALKTMKRTTQKQFFSRRPHAHIRMGPLNYTNFKSGAAQFEHRIEIRNYENENSRQKHEIFATKLFPRQK